MDTEASLVHKEELYRKHRFLTRVGRDFVLGSAIGAALHSVPCYRSAPAGGRLAGAAIAGGYIGAYAAMLYMFEGAMARSRGKHDLWNTVAASGAAFGLLHVPVAGRGAVVPALFGAAIGGIFSSAITTFRTKTPSGSISIDHKQKGRSFKEFDEKLPSLLREMKRHEDMEHSLNGSLNMIAKDMTPPSEPSSKTEAGDQADEP